MTGGRETYPRQAARTRDFTLGLPRTFTVAADGSRMVFLRSPAGDDPVTEMWVLDVPDGHERPIGELEATAVNGGAEPPAERARRERARERAEGVVAYATDRNCSRAAFEVFGVLFLAELDHDRGWSHPRPAREPVYDPQIDPTGRSIAYVSGGALRVIGVKEADDRALVEEPGVSWGVAEFVAAEEMGRHHGFWWSPDGDRLAVARVDESPVGVWHIADPANPNAQPVAVRYPAAGTANADVSLHLVGLDGSRTEIQWDRRRFEYLCRVVWTEGSPLTILVQSRDQRTTQVLAVGEEGSTEVLREEHDDAWVDLVEGSPAWLADGRLVMTTDLDDTRRLIVADEPVTPPGLQVRRIVGTADDVVFTASEEPDQVHVWRWTPDGVLERLTQGSGVHDAEVGGDTLVVTSATMDGPPTATVHRKERPVTVLASTAEEPVLAARPEFFLAGKRDLRAALLLPQGRKADRPLPVLLDPYGGPHHQRVMQTRDRFLESQWFADQGFAVLVADGRGTPGRGPAWEREIYRNVLAPVLEDQVDALHAAAERFGTLDLSRVAIRGWSFGGELAAAAILRRPDVFHAAVVGAPVTDQRLYDTHYTERYLGHPDWEPNVYRANSVLDDAPALRRPMLLIHGLADDNVVAAHSLRFSRALLEAGRPHTFLPLPGITHMASAEAVAENLLLLQLRFLRDALGMG
jgi:dipeptidyl-peptidase 4